MKIILLALRSLTRFRLYTAINIIGLALSLACVITISRYVYSESTTDHFTPEHDRICLSIRYIPNTQQPPVFFTTDNVLMRKEYKNLLDRPEVERKSSFVSLSDVTIEADQKKFSAHVLATDTGFLQILRYPLLAGERNRLLADPKGAVISRMFAKKLFGDQDPIGKNIQYNEHLLTIQGVTGETSTAASLSFDLLISKELQWRWPPVNYYSIALMNPGVNLTQVNTKIKADYQQAGGKGFFYQLFPLDKLYTDTTINKGENTFRQGNSDSLRILSLVAVLLLLTGIFNFIHISSVVILKRGRELGMKKVFGAKPSQLFIQLYLENLVLTAVALFIGWVIIEITHNLQVNELQIGATVNSIFTIGLSFSLLFGLPLVITLYPFFRYSYQQAITSLQGIVPGKRKVGMRSVGLLIQYCITICLIVSSLFFVKQLDYMLNADPGYQTKDIIKAWFERPSSRMVITQEDQNETARKGQHIEGALKTSPLFTAYSYGTSPYEFPNDMFNTVKMRNNGDEWEEVLYIKVPPTYFNLYKIAVSGSLPTSTDEVILNETAVKLFADKGNLPQTLELSNYEGIKPCKVTGTTSDFQVVHLSRQNPPVVMTTVNEPGFQQGKLMVSYVAGRKQEAIQFLKKLHEETEGGEFEYTFVEDEIHELYRKDKQIATIYTVFALIAILISSLGLFGLSLFDVQQRYREIAIRKVNGATTSVIMRMLLGKYYKLLCLAFIIAIPLSWLAISKYLENFVNKASLSGWIFVTALLITAVISLTTLIWQTGKAARTNPAKAIKQE